MNESLISFNIKYTPLTSKLDDFDHILAFLPYLILKIRIIIAAMLRIFFLLLLTGCSSYKIPSSAWGSSHTLYDVIPRHRSQIRSLDIGHWITWALFGNDDDGLFGEGANYYPEEPETLSKAVRWGVRNPLHNFCFYVIGSAHRKNSEVTLLSASPSHFEMASYKEEAETVFPSRTSCFYLGLHGLKPFISLRLAWSESRRSDFYVGWREKGNFGLKFQPFHKLPARNTSCISSHCRMDKDHFALDALPTESAPSSGEVLPEIDEEPLH